jgi:hypothetical protein
MQTEHSEQKKHVDKHADKNCPQSMHTEHPDMTCRQNIHTHYAHIHVCRLNPHTNYTTRRCRQIMQTGKQKEHADKVYWLGKCSRSMQAEHVEKSYKKNMQEKNMYMYIDYANKLCRDKRRKTCSQDKQTKRADRTSGQIMQTEHAQTFSNFCDIYAEPSQVYLFFNS